MSSDENADSDYRAYLIRLWPVCSGGQTVWRASAEDAHSGERRAFADMDHLFAFLEETVRSGASILKDEECPRENE